MRQVDSTSEKRLWLVEFLGESSYLLRNDDVIFRYVCYDMIHYYTHHGSIRKGSWIDKIRKYHIDHHFIDPNKGESCYVIQK